MSDFKFKCPHCEQSLEAPEDMLGQVVECPDCKQSIQLPPASPKTSPGPSKHTKVFFRRRERTRTSPSNRSSTAAKTKACPFCGEEILAVALKCKHCGSDLTGGGKQNKAIAPQKAAKTSSTAQGCGCLIVLVFVGIIWAVVSQTGSPKSSGEKTTTKTEEKSSIVDLNASVSFNGTQFLITNKDSFDWTNVKLEINSKTFSSGYTLRTGVMQAGEIYTVGAMQFAKSDGEKFNPFTHKALNLSVWCDTPRGKGSYYGTWK